ncbi:MAG: patatin-like phospholipase family protein, partial [Bacteroidetes bacterium]|nr:patatin-like phospholipase family protein [Bacteroidota bacterium]
KPGLVDTEKMADILTKYIEVETFEQLKCKLFVAATDIINAKVRFFNEGPLIRPIIASASFPLVFTPTEHDGNFFLDGGIVNNFPLEPIKLFCDVSLGVNISPMRTNIGVKDLDGYLEVIQRVYELGSDADTQSKMILCDFLICPHELTEYGTFDRGNVEKIFEIGYNYANKIIDKLKAKL